MLPRTAIERGQQSEDTVVAGRERHRLSMDLLENCSPSSSWAGSAQEWKRALKPLLPPSLRDDADWPLTARMERSAGGSRKGSRPGEGSSSLSSQQQHVDYLPDARQRGRVSIAHVLPPSRDIARRRARGGIPADLVFSNILCKSFLALALHLVKEWILHASKNPDVPDVAFKLGLVAAALTALWHRPWQVFRSSSKIDVSFLFVSSMRVLQLSGAATRIDCFACPSTGVP